MTSRLYTCRGILAAIVVVCIMFACNVILLAYFMDRFSLDRFSKFFEQNHEPSTSTLSIPVTSKDTFRTWNSVETLKNPLHWPGEMGRPVVIPPDEESVSKKKFSLNEFNVVASDKIALNRTLPDYRMKECKSKQYALRLPTTSIVIVFHNEAWSTLLRTVHSVIRMSPKELIEEIILVDDASDRSYLGNTLKEYVAGLSVPVKILRLGLRSGLIHARIKGAEVSKGQVITFLDAHCECAVGWLEPLLDRIAQDRRRIVCPIVNVINYTNFQYIAASDRLYGGFNWQMNFRWFNLPRSEIKRRNGDKTAPIRTPVMAGGLFSIDRSYFEEIGKYDDGMKIWGAENLELSFRIWMCGGTLEIIPCSHVGHVFRDNPPYTFPGKGTNVVNQNKIRLVNVWLDEWKNFFYSVNEAAKNVSLSDVTDRIELRKKLQCKTFRWYLENIYPESSFPLDYYYLGEIRNEKINKCLDTLNRKNGENVAILRCNGLRLNQVFLYTKRKQILTNDNCLDAAFPTSPVKLVRCHGMGGNQEWNYDSIKKTIRHVRTGKCLDIPDRKDVTLPVLSSCDGKQSQMWSFKKQLKWRQKEHAIGKFLGKKIKS